MGVGVGQKWNRYRLPAGPVIKNPDRFHLWCRCRRGFEMNRIPTTSHPHTPHPHPHPQRKTTTEEKTKRTYKGKYRTERKKRIIYMIITYVKKENERTYG